MPALTFVMEMGIGPRFGPIGGNLAPHRETDASLHAGDRDSEPDGLRAGCDSDPPLDTANPPAVAAHCWHMSGCKIADPA